MAATDITAFPTATNRILVHGDNQYTFTAAETLKAGQVVQVKASGGNFKIYAADATNAIPPIGVVDQNATTGDTDVTVNLWGTVCKVANFDDTTAIEAGTCIKCATVTATSASGAVCAWAGGASEYIVGTAITDIAANGWGDAIILPQLSIIT
jgi:hypothetical protein